MQVKGFMNCFCNERIKSVAMRTFRGNWADRNVKITTRVACSAGVFWVGETVLGTLNSIRQTDVDTLMIRTQSRVRVRVWVRVWVRVIYLHQTSVYHQIRGGVGVRVMHSRSDAPSSNPIHSTLNCFFP